MGSRGNGSVVLCCAHELTILATACESAMKATPFCADDSWALWNQTNLAAGDGFFCCAAGQIGTQAGECVASDTVVAATLSAVLVSSAPFAVLVFILKSTRTRLAQTDQSLIHRSLRPPGVPNPLLRPLHLRPQVEAQRQLRSHLQARRPVQQKARIRLLTRRRATLIAPRQLMRAVRLRRAQNLAAEIPIRCPRAQRRELVLEQH